MATVAVRGRTRKERIEPDAFSWQIDRMAEVQEKMATATTEANHGSPAGDRPGEATPGSRAPKYSRFIRSQF